MTAPRRPEELPTLPGELSDRLLALLFGDPAAREAAFAGLLAANPNHAEALQAHHRHHVAMEAGLEAKPATGDTTSIPGYRLLEPLGEGGMGTVYRAEQLRPVHRLVALKVIKPGMDSKVVLARFEQERQALAAMDHDAIAKVFDCGTTVLGQPFFAMELVDGLPIHRYCDEQRLSLRDRLALFAQVCRGVHHAHQKGIVHRDLKPGNILVVGQQGQHAVKIIDFGVARAMDRSLAQGSLFTEQGMVVGTPEYMSPEQACGNVARVDTRTDVYSLGVILYELLVGELPFPSAELRAAAFGEVQRRLLEDEPPKPSTRLSTGGAAATECAARRGLGADALRRELAGDLDWVVLKAMAKEPERRYESATALADDVQRYLAHEALVAGPPSAGYRVRKFVRRHRGRVVAGAAVFVTAVVGAVVALQFALREQAKNREFDLLSGVVLHERAVEAEKELYPPWPHKIAAMERWLREDCGRLLAMKPVIEQTVALLESRALPHPGAGREEERRVHPKYAEWVLASKRAATLRRAQAIRSGMEPLVVPELPPSAASLSAEQLERQALARVSPNIEERDPVGEEAIGLAYARAALAKAVGTREEQTALEALSWALLANGQDDEAKQRNAEAVRLLPAAGQDEAQLGHVVFENQIDNARQLLAAAEQAHADLTREVDAGWRFRFALESEAFLHSALRSLQGKLREFEQKEIVRVQQRLSWARQIGPLSLRHPRARRSWAEAREAIALADDVVASRLYQGQPIDLRDEDVVGLVPLGMNPQTRLWEFYDLRSAWDGSSDPAQLPIPELGPDGAIGVTAETGVVFVLLPGGTFFIGSQRNDPNEPNYDPESRESWGPPHAVTLAPFLLARHEMTQGQWARLWTGDERFEDAGGGVVKSQRMPSHFKAGLSVLGTRITQTHPVESVDWNMCDTTLRRNGMQLPTEAQWEYGCRATMSTPWSCDYEDLGMHANLADATARQSGARWSNFENWEDGHVVHAPVGSYLPNAFGLYDMHGNVSEWCLDGYGFYSSPVAAGDGRRSGHDGYSARMGRIGRGGAYCDTVDFARSAARGHWAPNWSNQGHGVRAARSLRL